MNGKSEIPQLLTVAAFADATGLAQVTIWKWIRTRRLASTKLGRARRIGAGRTKKPACFSASMKCFRLGEPAVRGKRRSSARPLAAEHAGTDTPNSDGHGWR